MATRDATASGEEPSTKPDLPAPIIAREGWLIVAIFVVVWLGLTVFCWWGLWMPLAWAVGVIGLALNVWCVWFFRDPRRRIPAPKDGLEPIVSPADGVVCDIKAISPPVELEVPIDEASRMTRVSVFMNVFNVHVNRAPIACTVVKTVYRPGAFFNASFDKASEHNERMSLRLRMADKREVVCVQIAGLIVRRIVCRVKQGAILGTGDRFGIIRFGSRVDVYLPGGVTPAVKVGDKTVAGETVIGWLAPKAVAGKSPEVSAPAKAVARAR